MAGAASCQESRGAATSTPSACSRGSTRSPRGAGTMCPPRWCSNLSDPKLWNMPAALDPDVDALLARSHRLGADRRVTNYARGTTSAKVAGAAPVPRVPTSVLVVKGSGGDLGTLTTNGLAWLDLDRVRALEQLAQDGTHE